MTPLRSTSFYQQQVRASRQHTGPWTDAPCVGDKQFRARLRLVGRTALAAAPLVLVAPAAVAAVEADAEEVKAPGLAQAAAGALVGGAHLRSHRAAFCYIGHKFHPDTLLGQVYRHKHTSASVGRSSRNSAQRMRMASMLPPCGQALGQCPAEKTAAALRVNCRPQLASHVATGGGGHANSWQSGMRLTMIRVQRGTPSVSNTTPWRPYAWS